MGIAAGGHQPDHEVSFQAALHMLARRNHIDKYPSDDCVIPGSQDGSTMSTWSRWVEQWGTWMAALFGPAIVTAVLVNFNHQVQRDHVFLCLRLVGGGGAVRGLSPALLSAR